MGVLKERIAGFVRSLPQELRRLVRLYPVESGLILLEMLGCIGMYEFKWSERAILSLALLPLFTFVALALNNLTAGSPWRKVYWVSWAPLIPLLFWSGLDAWAKDERLPIALGVLAPLALLMCRRALDNDRFVADAVVWLRSAVLAGLFANVALGLFLAIFYSTIYIFSLDGKWVESVTVYTVIFTESWCVPMLFLGIADRWRSVVCRGNRIAEVLLNWIVTPALLIYGAILYLYMLRIVFTWSLPRGGVAYMVFAFMIVAILVKGVQGLLPRRIYAWVFDRFSLLSLPMAVLFWVGTLHRVAEYGLTEARVWLVVCGALMTLCVVLFLSRRTGRYLWVAAVGFVTFLVLIAVPPMFPGRIALRSQTQRAERIAACLGLLDPEGRVDVSKIQAKDSLDLRKLHAALTYLEYTDAETFERFGVKDMDVLEFASGESEEPCKPEFPMSIINSSGIRVPIAEGYKMLYADIPWEKDVVPSYQFDSDTLRLQLEPGEPAVEIPTREIIEHMFTTLNTRTPSVDAILAAADSLLVYDTGKAIVLFSQLSIDKDADGEFSLYWLSVADVITR